MKRSQKPIRVGIKPELIKWAIKSSGWKYSELAERLDVDISVINSWESGDSQPTLKELDKLAATLKRPIAVFFLPEAPKELPIPKDYRILPSNVGEFDKETVMAIRKARRLQKTSKELLENQNESAFPRVNHVSLNDNPFDLALEIRSEFGITEDLQKRWKNAYDAFNYIREKIEANNIFVFQMQMPIEDARGFVLADTNPFVIVVNSSDNINARIFTLLHEYGHVLLKESGVDNPDCSADNQHYAVERWCNNFASEFILPSDILKKEIATRDADLMNFETNDKFISKMKVSKSMFYYKLYLKNYIDSRAFNEVMDILRRGNPNNHDIDGFGMTVERRVLREKGQKYVSLVSNNIEKGLINHNDALDYLSIKRKDLDKVASKGQ